MVMVPAFPENTFLIEIRLARTKWRIKRITERITDTFSVPEFAERHPHVTLFGPFTLRKRVTISRLKQAIEETAAPFPTIPYLIDGYDMNQGLNGAVLAYRVRPSDVLVSLNREISASVLPLAGTVNVWDTDPAHKWFHITIANRLDRDQGVRIFEHLTGERRSFAPLTPPSDNPCTERGRPESDDGGWLPPSIPQPPLLDEDGIRISIIHGEEILAEYDLPRHRWFRPKTLSSAREWQRSLRRFRKDRGIELTRRGIPAAGGPFVIGDLHLGHANIIRYCSRPFPHDAVSEMDSVLIRNWNATVRRSNRVFHLGDFSYTSGKSTMDYLRLLNGSITRIAGNHDKDSGEGLPHQISVTSDGIPFTLTHDPDDAVPVPGGWVIHGHYHNNDLSRYPFISFRDRRINVSAEVVGYRPVPLDELAGIIRKNGSGSENGTILLRRI